jgi:hypothetical protein
LANYEWKSSKGKPEKSIWTLQLSTFGFTSAKQQDKNPVIELKDIKVSQICFVIFFCNIFHLLVQVFIKLKSTTTVGGPDESATDGMGLSFDGYGYACTLLHFVGLLKSKDFAIFVQRVRTVVHPKEAEESRPEEVMSHE